MRTLLVLLVLSLSTPLLADDGSYNRWSEKVLNRWGTKNYSYQHPPQYYQRPYGYQSQRVNVTIHNHINNGENNESTRSTDAY